jgi:hypothetical protein
LAYNNPSVIGTHRAAFIEAINAHNYQKLLNVVEKAKAVTFSADDVKRIISGTTFKDYYRTVHFNNL